MRAFESIHFAAPTPGTRLIVTGAVHGNETCGTLAIRRVLDEISRGQLAITAGEVSFVPVTNPLAYQRGQRQGDRNLNRRLATSPDPREFEDHVANWLCPLLARHEVLLDLHSFHSAGEPFVLVGPENSALEPFGHAAREEALAVRLGVRRIVDGWLSTYAGGVARRRALLELQGPRRNKGHAAQEDGASREGHENNPAPDLHADYGVGTTEYMRRVGGWAFTLECGAHSDPRAPEVAYRAILNTLAHLRLIDAPDPAPAVDVEALRLTQVIDKAHAQDHFARAWASFDAVRAGELIGTRHDGAPLHAQADGRIVFPNPGAAPGQEWFYIAYPHARFGV